MKTIVDYARKVKEQHALNKNLAPIEADASASSKAYAIGQHFILNGELYKAKTAIALGDALVLDTNYEAAGSIEAQIETLDAENKTLTNQVKDMNNILGAKNLLPNNAASTTTNGITFTVNGDGSITANGTATANIRFIITQEFTLKAGVGYKITGVEGTNPQTDNIHVFARVPNSTWLLNYPASASIPDTYTPQSDTEVEAGISFNNGDIADNLTFYPMIRLAGTNDTYVPYAKTNRELTEVIKGELTGDVIFTSNSVVKQNNIVTINAVFEADKDYAGFTQIVNIPSGFRPLNINPTSILACDNNNTIIIPLTAFPDGKIQGSGALVTGYYYRFSMTYIIA